MPSLGMLKDMNWGMVTQDGAAVGTIADLDRKDFDGGDESEGLSARNIRGQKDQGWQKEKDQVQSWGNRLK